MRTTAARLHEHGQPLVIESVELPEPDPDEVLVTMSFAGVNPVDRNCALGRVAADAPLPRTLGIEGLGELDGRMVLIRGHGIATDRDGLWAKHAVVPRAALVDVPADVAPEQAAVVGVAGATACWTVSNLAKVTTEDRVLVLGASGGVGSMIVSLVHALGATVWAQTGSESKAVWVRDRGADHVVVGDAEALADQIGTLEPTVVFDSLGNGFTGAAVTAMAPHGRLVIFGASADSNGNLPLQALYRNGISILGYAGLIEARENIVEAESAALRALSDGSLEVCIDEVVPLEETNAALRRLDGREVTGKLVLDLR